MQEAIKSVSEYLPVSLSIICAVPVFAAMGMSSINARQRVPKELVTSRI